MAEPTHVDGPVGPVVVGCDGSWPSAQAVIAASAAARRRGAQLKLLVVVRPPATPTEGHEVAAQHARYVGETARLAADRVAPDLDTEVVIAPDVRDVRVRQLANQAGLLVLGSSGAGGQVALSLGSASDDLARTFPCPLLLPHARVGESLRAGSRPPTVVAAVGHDDGARHVVAAAAREAAERHVPLVIVHSLSTPDVAALASEQDWVAAVVAAVGVPSWLPYRTVVTVADPVAAVLDRVESDDLLVVATRGEGRLAGLVRGSVTRALLDAGRCDVLVVDHGIAGPGEAHPTAGLASEPAEVDLPTPAAPLDLAECWSLLRGAAVGRIGVAVGGRQDIFPVNHVVSGQSVVFRTAPGSKLDACVDQPVAFEVDGFDTTTGDAWSVVLKGTARELVGRDEIIQALRLPLTPWPAEPKPRIVSIDPDDDPDAVTGRRFHVYGALTAVTSSAIQRWLAAPGPDPVPTHH